jgi:pyruvate/2-oxoglutarate dehydrogenase complex dihydrolipoamide dehydrogenase (E3) component
MALWSRYLSHNRHPTTTMDKFDLIVIGTGAGAHVASQAANEGMQVALLDQGPAGGTCLNNGCIPSKMLIYPADVIRTIQEAGAVGVHAEINEIDFPAIMSRMHKVVDKAQSNLEEALKAKENLTYFQERAEFVDDYVLQVGGVSGKTITAPKIVIATGARSLVPPIPGLLEEETGRIMGATVVGPMASELVQQVVYLMNTEYQDLMPVVKSQVIHPTINEVLVRAFSELEHPIHQHGPSQ